MIDGMEQSSKNDKGESECKKRFGKSGVVIYR